MIERLRDQPPTDGSSDLLASLFTAVQSDADPSIERRQVILLTDGQRADWKTGDDRGWRQFREVLQKSPLPTQIEFISLESSAKTANPSARCPTAR